MKKIGCFVCNFNKREFVVNCVKSLLEQTCKDIDIYVIDNASTDDSVEALQKEYGDQIQVVVNAENLGGSGGFNTGLRIALKKNYQYAVLIDNDVRVDPNAIQIMYDYMETHKDVGILGAKILNMQKPNVVQELGGSITKNMNILGNYFDKIDENLPEILESDCICTCTAMTRVDLMKKFGLMPEDNFIYWDDIEWSKKCQLAGYKTVAINAAKVWHNRSYDNNMPSSFTRYYNVRNRFNYFLKYTEEDKLDDCIEQMLMEVLHVFFSFNGKGYTELVEVVSYAFDDLLHQVRGKAAPYKIKNMPVHQTPFEKRVLESSNIKIKFTDNFKENNENFAFSDFELILRNVQKVNPQNRLGIDLSNCSYTEEEFIRHYKHMAEDADYGYKFPEVYFSSSNEGYDLCLTMCKDAKLIEKNILPEVYVDRYCNCITSEKDYIYFKSFDTTLQFFKSIYRPLLKQAAEKIRANRDQIYS